MVRAGRRGRGPCTAPLEGKWREYAELVARGVGNALACCLVCVGGIGERGHDGATGATGATS